MFPLPSVNAARTRLLASVDARRTLALCEIPRLGQH